MAGKFFSLRGVALLMLSLSATHVYALDVTVAYQTSAEPAKVAQAANSFAKQSGATVDWRKFDSGSSVLRALASGDVQIGNIGSSPLAVAASQKLPIEVFLIAAQLGSAEALVVTNGINSPQGLIGKRIAVPFISTAYYSLLASLKLWGIKPEQVKILNLQPPAIAAAWQRGDIDGAYVWAPVVNELVKQGKVLTNSEQVGQWGAPTFDVWVVRKDFADKHPAVVVAFATRVLAAQKAYLVEPEKWLKDQSNLSTLARLCGISAAQVPERVRGNIYMPVALQITQLGQPMEQTIRDTAEFLKQQGKIPQVDSDYSAYVTDRFVQQVQAAPQP
ncbi:taurine ABC transporter substrate-binding protein [Serratia symbiotica]|uniref:Taurine-binding periplasmic protein n=1 Tax=Serratia symbiotica SCt-VLC TaxID=1347341 RepID=A0A068RBB0_9GAMM|nr:taurine ABC transporter substrate-binding protein [Serratia symbiotica]CDG46796.1 Taurine-binding periplasmic protein [Serratia symbiotica SCt-VLC]